MSDENKLLDAQIHDAYEGVRLSDEAQDRMLANLLAAQSRREAADADAAAPLELVDGGAEVTPRRPKAAHLKPREAEATPTARHRRTWKVVLPLAAVLLVAVVVVRLQTKASDNAASMAETTEAPLVVQESEPEEKSLAADEAADGANAEGTSEDTTEEESLDEIPEYYSVDEYGIDPTAVGLYPRVTLADGTLLTTLIDGQQTLEVESARVGESVGAAKATPFDTKDEEIDCEVFKLIDDADGYAVRYDEEESYWYATRME